MVKKSLSVSIMAFCCLVLPLTSYTITLTPQAAIAETSKTYRVKLGDTLSGIGVKFGLTIPQLLNYKL